MLWMKIGRLSIESYENKINMARTLLWKFQWYFFIHKYLIPLCAQDFLNIDISSFQFFMKETFKGLLNGFSKTWVSAQLQSRDVSKVALMM